jgi:hypothetical protein
MANVNAASGLQPYAYAWGAPWGGAVRTYYVPVGNGTALYLGDPVALVTNSSDGNGIQTAEIASAGGSALVLGAFMGVSNNAGQTTIPVLQSQPVYLPASTAAYIYVSDDPFLLYKIQEDGVGGAMASGASGRNADLVAGSGSTVTALSGWQLDSSTLQTTSTLQLRIIQLLQESDNAIGLSAKWLVKLNTSQMLSATGT